MKNIVIFMNSLYPVFIHLKHLVLMGFERSILHAEPSECITIITVGPILIFLLIGGHHFENGNHFKFKILKK